MFRPPVSNPALKRSIRPLYAQHQATPQGGFLDPAWNKSFDILPGIVMARKQGEVYTPFTNAAGQVPYGLSALWVAPVLGVDEVTATNTNLFTVWVGGGADNQFEILAPAFDTAADWSLPTDGTRKLLGGNAQGRLTPGATGTDVIAELIDVPSTDKIIIRLLPPQIAAA